MANKNPSLSLPSTADSLPTKAACRRFNLDALNGSLHIADYKQRNDGPVKVMKARPGLAVVTGPWDLGPADPMPDALWLDWVDATREHGMLELLTPLLHGARRAHEAGAVQAGRFVGVDTIRRKRARKEQDAVWLTGRLPVLISTQPEAFETAGVITYDSIARWCDESIVDEAAPLVRFAATQQYRVGEFVLIVNGALSQPEATAQEWERVQRIFTPMLAPLDRRVELEDVFTYRDGDASMLNVRVRVGYR